MDITKTMVFEFIGKLEASRSNLVDEIMYESMIQTERDQGKKDSAKLDRLMAELADVQTAIAAFREDANTRSW